MINSKGIRILCYVAMGISYFIAIVLLICGCSALVNDKGLLGIGLIAISFFIPFFSTLSLYPIFALSLIESHVADLNANVEKLTEKISCTSPKPTSTILHEPKKAFQDAAYKTQSSLSPTPPFEEALNFINRIANANNFDEVCSIIKMHHTVSKNTFTKQ